MTLDEAESTESVLPMLAQDYRNSGHRIVFPAYAQRKLDGVRCLVTRFDKNVLTFMSRSGKDYGPVMCKHERLYNDLLKLLKPGDVLDGELYVHGWTLQKITSATKKLKPNTLELEFWAFDFPSVKEPWRKRIHALADLFEKVDEESPIKYVNSVQLNKADEVKTYHDQFVKEGFEGIIIRNLDGIYRFGVRSADLQKYKEFLEDEFEIVDSFEEIQNKNKKEYTCIVFVCQTKDEMRFNCRPRGSLKQREEWWNEREAFVGKKLTVRYFALTDDTEGKGKKVPQFPVGVCVRDYE